MPNNNVLEQKKALVASLTEKLQSAACVVLVDYKGINVADDTKLRKELREANVDYFVAKNTMLSLAAKNVGYDDLCPLLNGTTAIAISTSDVVAPAKILAKQAEAPESTFSLKGGYIEGKFADVNELNAIAKLPSRETLIAQVVCGLNSPIAGLAIALNAIAEKQSA